VASAALPFRRFLASADIDPSTMSLRRKFLLFGIMAFGMFMAILDIQIVAASLNAVQAGLSAGPDEIAWVQTSYLMAEVVMIPLSAFLVRALSTRWVFAASAALFTISSAMCGMAGSIEQMIAFRAIQGFVGGAMIPTAFATGFLLFEGKQRAFIPAIMGLVPTIAPAIGPTVGGWVTDAYSWRWIFFMNIVPGVFITIAVPLLGRIDKGDLSMLKRIDWLHLVSLIVFLAGLQYMLEEGPRHDWFNDAKTAIAGWASLIGFCVFLERSLFGAHPLVNLRPFKRRTFAIACFFNTVIGFGLYASVYLTPLFLGRVRGFNSTEIGQTVFVQGIAMTCSIPFIVLLTQRVDTRVLIVLGLTGFAVSLWMTTGISPQWGFEQLFWCQALRGFSMMFCAVPAVGFGIGTAPPEEVGDASGLFNLSRNMGGAVGIALVNTWLQDMGKTHWLRLSEAMASAPQGASEMMSGMTAIMGQMTADAGQATLMAESMVNRILVQQSTALAFDDAFGRMALLFVCALPLALLAKPPPIGGEAVAAH
jgi:MFS transporter, DHA2 family, multidrug resistance protein